MAAATLSRNSDLRSPLFTSAALCVHVCVCVCVCVLSLANGSIACLPAQQYVYAHHIHIALQDKAGQQNPLSCSLANSLGADASHVQRVEAKPARNKVNVRVNEPWQ